jgi:magnesium chelatase family protein
MCTPPQVQRYVSKVSGPLLDRIDIHIEVPAVQYKELRGTAAAEGSAEIRARVLAARDRQHQRFVPAVTAPRPKNSGRAAGTIFSNAQMTTQQIRTFCELSTDAERLLERAMQQQGLSARAHDRILKVARTIADLDGVEDIAVKHLAEAIQYRTLDRSHWS